LKIEELSDPDRPSTATFAEHGDCCSGIIAREPIFEPDQFDSDKRVLVIVVRDDKGIHYRVFARTQMVDAIRDAAAAAGATEISAGDSLTVTYRADRGRMKVFSAEYIPAAGIDQGAPF
jgi:hypothetical protein